MNQSIQIYFKQSDWDKLTLHLSGQPELESGAYAVFKMSTNPSTIRFLVKQIIIPIKTDYHRRTASAIAFTPGFTESAFRTCEETNGHLLDIHTHPWSEQVQFSGIDDHEAQRTKIPYMTKYVPDTRIAFIVMGKCADIVSARFWDNDRNRLQSINRIVVI